MSSDGFVGAAQLIVDLLAFWGEMPEVTEPAVLETAREAANAAKQNVRVWSGRHQRSIHVGGHPELTPDFSPARDKNWYKDLGRNRMDRKRLRIFVGTTLFYGYWEEFGGAKAHNEANPAIRRAVETHAPRLEPRLVQAVDALRQKHNL